MSYESYYDHCSNGTDEIDDSGVTSDDSQGRYVKHITNQGYCLLRSEGENSVSNESDNDIEYPQSIQQRIEYGAEHDESVEADSSSDDCLSRPDSSLYMTTVKPTGMEPITAHTYHDEEHVVVSSSSESSPRQQLQSRPNFGKYSRHFATTAAESRSASSFNQPSEDPGGKIHFPGLEPSTYSYEGFNKSTTTHNSDSFSQSCSTEDVTIDIEDEQLSESSQLLCNSFRPGGAQLNSSSYTGYGSDAVTSSDAHSSVRRLVEDPNSIEAQHPGRVAHNTSGASNTASTNSSNSFSGRQMTNLPETKGDNYNKLLERRKKKMEDKQKGWTKSEGNEMDLPDLLAYLGVESEEADKSKKKKEKKEKKGAPALMVNKTIEATASVALSKKDINEKLVARSKGKKGKKGRQFADNSDKLVASTGHMDNSDSSASNSFPTTEIISAKSNVSRIIINGDAALDPEISDALGLDLSVYSERNIDEAVALHEKNQASQSTEGQPVCVESPTEADEETVKSSSVDGNIIDRSVMLAQSVDENHFDFDDFMYEDDFNRIKNPEPVEEEFQVVHKKKKLHRDKLQTTAAVDKPVASYSHLNSMPPQTQISTKPKSKHLEQPVRPVIPTVSKYADADTEKTTPATNYITPAIPVKVATTTAEVNKSNSVQYDLSESSFPSLSDTKSYASVSSIAKATATVTPFSYAAKAAPKVQHFPPFSSVSNRSQPKLTDNYHTNEETKLTVTLTPTTITTTTTTTPPTESETCKKPPSVNIAAYRERTPDVSLAKASNENRAPVKPRDDPPSTIPGHIINDSSIVTGANASLDDRQSSSDMYCPNIIGDKNRTLSNTNAQMTTATKTSRPVEFLDGFSSDVSLTGSKIQFGFVGTDIRESELDPGSEQVLEFGFPSTVCSLPDSSNSESFEPTSADVSKNKDILAAILSVNSHHDYSTVNQSVLSTTGYRRVISMLHKEWNCTVSSTQRREKRLPAVYWSESSQP